MYSCNCPDTFHWHLNTAVFSSPGYLSPFCLRFGICSQCARLQISLTYFAGKHGNNNRTLYTIRRSYGQRVHYQQVSKQAEDKFGRRPIRFVDGRQEIVDKVFKQRSIVVLAFRRTSTSQRIKWPQHCVRMRDGNYTGITSRNIQVTLRTTRPDWVELGG